MQLDWRDLQYTLIDPCSVDASQAQVTHQAFRLWNQVWSQTLFELDGTPTVFSDEFTRQDLIGCLIYRGRCVGLSCFRWADFSLLPTQLDSYFKAWPKSALTRLLEDGSKILITSQLTVDPTFRGEISSGIRLKDLLVGLQVKVLLDSECDAQPLIPRCDRGMAQVVYRYGAIRLEPAVLHGVEVDLAATYRRRIHSVMKEGFDFPVELLWRNRKTTNAFEAHKAA